MSTQTQRIPLNTFAIAFGLAGLAELWTETIAEAGGPSIVPLALWSASAIALAWLVAAHLLRGRRVAVSLKSQVRDPAQGPLAAIPPVVAMLLGLALFELQPFTGRFVILIAMLSAAVFAAWLISVWFVGDRPADAVHGGYFLPTVAAAYVAADAAQVAGWPLVALGAFAVGTLFWVTIQTLLIARLAIRPPLPEPLVPSMAILSAPPAVGGIAWFAISGGRVDPLQAGFAGIGAFFLVVQLFLVPRYLKLRFTLGFWSFTFPAAATGTYIVTWMDAVHAALLTPVAFAISSAVTVLVLWIAVRSAVDWFRAAREKRRNVDIESVVVADDALSRGSEA